MLSVNLDMSLSLPSALATEWGYVFLLKCSEDKALARN